MLSMTYQVARARQAEGRIDLYTRSVLEHANEATERDITWLDALIEAEKGQS